MGWIRAVLFKTTEFGDVSKYIDAVFENVADVEKAYVLSVKPIGAFSAEIVDVAEVFNPRRYGYGTYPTAPPMMTPAEEYWVVIEVVSRSEARSIERKIQQLPAVEVPEAVEAVLIRYPFKKGERIWYKPTIVP